MKVNDSFPELEMTIMSPLLPVTNATHTQDRRTS